MSKPIERELKILVTKEIYEEIIKSYDFTKPWNQTNTYFDTSDRYIKSKKGACRIRTIGNKKIFTLKIRKDEITHIELEKEVDVDEIKDIKDPEILQWLKEYEIPTDLNEIVSFTTTRQTYDFTHAQLCADMTQYENHIDYEIEYEYFDDHDGIKEFNKILKPFGITYEKNCSSKIARAFQL